jgi:hypothetical protein
MRTSKINFDLIEELDEAAILAKPIIIPTKGMRQPIKLWNLKHRNPKAWRERVCLLSVRDGDNNPVDVYVNADDLILALNNV